MTEPYWVPETRFGIWFQGTNIWLDYVLSEALKTLAGMLPVDLPTEPVILDVGCGEGKAFKFLNDIFLPARIVGVDIDTKLVAKANHTAEGLETPIEVLHGDTEELSLTDNSIDIVLCHQCLHHVAGQAQALQEFRRILKPGGLLLLSESCRVFTESNLVKLLFRHPRGNQHSAEEYLTMLKKAGFDTNDRSVQTDTPWWSEPMMGLSRKLGLSRRKREATLLTLIARTDSTS